MSGELINSDQRPALVAMVDPPAIVARFDDVAMVRQSVQERGRHFGIGEHARPFGEGPAGPKLRNRTYFRTYHERRLYSEGFSLKFRRELRGGGYFDGEYWP